MEMSCGKRGQSEDSGRKVIFQRFERAKSRHAYPYPPVYREPDTDYICFTADEGVHSNHWRIERLEALEPYLAGYDRRFELAQNQIQMDSVFGENPEKNILTPPSLEELPLVRLDLEKFESTANENGEYIRQDNPVYRKGKYKGRPLLLTIGVPVSNQIGTIDRCLSHIKPLLDKLDAELVVVDTGSTDGTIEVCKEYGARVYEHPWHDNMSAVRNEALRHARGLWYMSIDDDEWFEDVEEILSFFKSGTWRQYGYAHYIQRNYMDPQGKFFNNFHTMRMAEITPMLHFEGRIHDALTGYAGKNYNFGSYAHHYGFLNDPERQWTKFLRNMPILLQDVHEYPENQRYLFQVANEYSVVRKHGTALGLFALCLSLSAEAGDTYRARQCASTIVACLYELNDGRIFDWAEHLEEEYHLITAERAASAWFLCHLAAAREKPAEEVLLHFGRYERLLQEYREDTDISKTLVFQSLPKVEHDSLIMGAMSIGFCFSLKAGEEERALGLLGRFTLEGLEERKAVVLENGFAVGDAVYGALCGKITPVQWEEWSRDILDAAGAVLTWKAARNRMEERLPGLISRMSVHAVLSWLASGDAPGNHLVRARLEEYALSCVREGRIFAEEAPVQELALCYAVLEKAYAREHERQSAEGAEAKHCEKQDLKTVCERQDGTQSSEETGAGQGGNQEAAKTAAVQSSEETGAGQGGKLGSAEFGMAAAGLADPLQAYLMAAGIFMERYYPPELLCDPGNTAIPPQDRAVYRMAAVMADGTADSGNIALLKQALAIYPPFHQEIKNILKGLAAQNGAVFLS